MGCWLLITCHYTPMVFLHIDIFSPHCYHRLDGYAQTILQQYAIATFAVVGHLWLFVHLLSNAVANKLANNTIAF